MDLPSLIALYRTYKPEFIVPLGNAKYLKKKGITTVTELDWWQTHDGVQLVPAQHWSARGLNDRNHALWGGFVVTMAGKRIFFAGDTGYGPHFRYIYEKLGPMDISLLPIGAYEPRWFMRDQHMNPDDAVKAHIDLQSRRSIAMHFETFRLTDEAFFEPREELTKALRYHNITDDLFLTPETGSTMYFT
jgi:L-ascorbate metabolism protein UlaG (beta-lactamase superfamily)